MSLPASLIPWPTGSEWHCFISLLVVTPWPTGSEWHCFISSCWQSPHDQQAVSDTALCLCQAVSSHEQQAVSDTALFLARQSHPMTNRKWVPHCFISLPGSLVWSIISHPMVTNREWVTLLYFFARQPHPMTNRESVTPLYFFASQSDPNDVSSHDQPWQFVSDIVLFICQTVLSHKQVVSDTALFLQVSNTTLFFASLSHPMTNRKWVTLLLYFCARQSHPMTNLNRQSVTVHYFFARQSQSHSCLIPCTLDSKWVILLYFFAQPSHPMTKSMWVTVQAWFLPGSSIQWPTGSEWHCFISSPGSLILWPTGSASACGTLIYLFGAR